MRAPLLLAITATVLSANTFFCSTAHADWIKDGTAEVEPGSETEATEAKNGSGTTTPGSGTLSVSATAAATRNINGVPDTANIHWKRSFVQKFKWDGGGTPTSSFNKPTTSTISGSWTLDTVFTDTAFGGLAVVESDAYHWSDSANSSESVFKKSYPVAPATGVSTGSINPTIDPMDAAKASFSFYVYAKANVSLSSFDEETDGKTGTATASATISIGGS